MPKWIVGGVCLGIFYIVLFTTLPSHPCETKSKTENVFTSCDCLGIKKSQSFGIVSECIGIRTKCYKGSKEDIFFKNNGTEIDKVVKHPEREVVCE